MKTDSVTFYTFDVHTKSYLRLAVVDSEGLANVVLQSFAKIYGDNLCWIPGSGKKIIDRNSPEIYHKLKSL